MDPATLALIGAGASAGAGVADSAIGFFGNRALQREAQEFNAEQAELAREWQTQALQKQMNFNADQAELQRAWERDMSSSAIQRQVRDMKAAGINPILAAGYGGSATPSGASASAGTGSANTASSPGASFRSDLARSASLVIDSINTASKIEKLSDEIEHSQVLREIYQSREKRDAWRFDNEVEAHSAKVAKEKSKSFDTDEFFEAAVRRALEDL